MSKDEAPPTPDAEGDAPPAMPAPSPRSLRIMAIVRWILLALVTGLAAYTVFTYWGPGRDAHATHRPNRYYCPMHAQIVSPDPGECPICHMTLEPIPEERTSPSTPEATSSAQATSPPETMTVTLDAEKQKAAGLMTSVVENGTLSARLRVPGVINAPESGLSQVRVRAPGFVEQVLVKQTGVRVRRGQALALVYSPEIYRAQEELVAATRWSGAEGASAPMQGASSDLVQASRRALGLLGMSAGDIDEVVRTGKPIRAVAVRAPAAGFITRFNAVLGSRAEPETVLYEIADLSTVWVIASVYERDMYAVREGMKARFLLAGSPSDALEGRVDLIEPLLEESTRTTRVRLSVANADGRLRPGQFGEVELELPSAKGLLVPRDAVIRTGEHEYVYVALDGDRFAPRIVRTGIAREGRVEVLSGLSAGERVVTRGSFMLDSESRLQASLASKPALDAGGAGGAGGASSPTHQGHSR